MQVTLELFLEAKLIHLSIKIAMPHQSGAQLANGFFKIEGFVGKRYLLSPPPPRSFHLFALAPFFARPEIRSRRSGTLATQATIWCNLWPIQNEGISLVAMRSNVSLKLDTANASRRLKTYRESRIELRNLQIFKKMLEKLSQFCHQSSPASRKAWTLHTCRILQENLL